MTSQDMNDTPSQAGRSAQAAWWRLRLFSPGWREDQHPDLNETVPGGWYGLDLVALGCAALVAGLGLRVCSLTYGTGQDRARDAVVVGQGSVAPAPGLRPAGLVLAVERP